MVNLENTNNQSWIETAINWIESSHEKRNELVGKVSAIVSEELEFVTGGSSKIFPKEKTEEFIKKLEEASKNIASIKDASSSFAQFLPKCFEFFAKVDSLKAKYSKDKVLTEDEINSFQNDARAAMTEIKLIEKLSKLSPATVNNLFNGKI